MDKDYKLIETGYADDEEALSMVKKYYNERYHNYKLKRIQSEYPTIIKYEIYIKDIKIVKSTQKKYIVKWYDNGIKEGIWKSDSVYELKEKLNKINIYPVLYIEVE